MQTESRNHPLGDGFAPGGLAVTGALGFTASYLVPALRARGATVVAVVRPDRDARALESQGIEVRRAGLERPEALDGVFEGVGTIVHLAGMALVPRLLPWLEAARLARGVFVGSTGVHTRLESAGAEAKRAGEAALRASTVAWTILRPTMIYGAPRDRNLARLLRWLRGCPVVPVPGGGRTLQQPVHVEDLVAAILAALDRPQTAGRAYDLGGPAAIPLADLIRESAAALGRRAWILPLPIGATYHAVRLLRWLRLPVPVRGEQVRRLAESKAVDIEPARRDLDFRPRSFGEGIRAEAAML